MGTTINPSRRLEASINALRKAITESKILVEDEARAEGYCHLDDIKGNYSACNARLRLKPLIKSGKVETVKVKKDRTISLWYRIN